MASTEKQFTEYIADYLMANGIDCACSGTMPPEPDRVSAVYATGLRSHYDEDGSRFQVICRSERNSDTALGDAMLVQELLDDFSGLLTIDSPYVHRILGESGVANIGLDNSERVLYSVNFVAYYC